MTTDLNIPKVEDFIKQLNEQELVYLNRLIIDRLNILAQVKSSVKMAAFHNGQRVSFVGPDGIERNGQITRLNKKTASVTTDTGHQWNVAPGLLRGLDEGRFECLNDHRFDTH